MAAYDYEVGECCGIKFDELHGRLMEDGSCADRSYKLICKGNKTMLYYGRYQVQAVAATNSSTLRSFSAGVDHDNCSTVDVNYISYNNFRDVFQEKLKKNIQYDPYYCQDSIAFLTCKILYCRALQQLVLVGTTLQQGIIVFGDSEVSEYEDSCSIDLIVNLFLSAPITCNENCSIIQMF